MGLFQRNVFNNDMPLYEVIDTASLAGSSFAGTTLLIVGLGNDGEQYDGTRHNIGFACIDNFATKHDFPAWKVSKDRHCYETSHTIDNNKVILCKPTTFMNESGRSMQAMQQFYKIKNDHTLVVYDEVDIAFGQIRTRRGGSSAGHNGIKSLTQHCGEDFGRVRVGVGPKKPAQMELADFVLSSFTKTQTTNLPKLLREANSILSEYSYSGGNLPEETRPFLI